MRHLLRGNREYREKVFGPQELGALAAKQDPSIFWIGCSDSRVPPEIITNSGVGELFVIRNIANTVPKHDASVGSVLEYAIRHLKIHTIVVCGHYGCGGLEAAWAGVDNDEEYIGTWLHNLDLTVEKVRDKLQSTDIDRAALSRMLTEVHLELQIANLMTYSCVEDAVGKEALSVTPLIYDLDTGTLVGYQAGRAPD